MSPLTASARVKTFQRAAVAMLLITGAVNYVDRVALSIANPLVRADLGLSIGEMGVLLSIFLWTYALCQLPVGALIDRLGPRWLLGIGVIIWSVAQAAVGGVTSMTQFVWTRIFLGIGESPQFPLGARVVRNWFNVRDRGTPTGIFNSASTLGPAIAPPLLTGLMLSVGWRMMFVVIGLVGIVVGVVWFFVYRDPSRRGLDAEETRYLLEGEDDTAGEAVSLSEWASLFRFRTTWGMIFGNFGSGYMIWLYAAWLPGYLEIQRHMTIAHTGIVASIPYVAGFIGSLFGGWFCDRLMAGGFSPINSRKLPIVIGMVGMAAFTVLAALVPSNTIAVVCITVSMFLGNMSGATIWALAVVAAPAKGVGSLGGMQNFGGFLGGALAPMITGFIVEVTHSFVPALVLAGVVGIGSALIYLLVVQRPVDLSEAMPGLALPAA
ncbi:MAG TPA: MFS transporter [Rhodopila sp.]|uniref:MFS transporter n=1 Tax=Rhodopila sp. TaxID=2480087 RepID=UPI002BFB3263|nr:MFS transporter [Rhodopila sp.]HVY17560.1 MFS transporter [Rhodopila sp.]